MAYPTSIADHWGRPDLYDTITTVLQGAGTDLNSVTIGHLAPVDHFHARGLQATAELADAIPVSPRSPLLDIGCGLGGPARFMAERFGVRVTGIDITPSFIETGNRLTELVGMTDQVSLQYGDGCDLPFNDASFGGVYSQHVTMNIRERRRFFGGAFRVIAPGGFFALTEHARGEHGELLHPVPWSEDGTGEFLVPPHETCSLLGEVGFVGICLTHTGDQYLEAYQRVIALSEAGETPALGIHLVMGSQAVKKTCNSASSIAEHRTYPIRLICVKP
jgi:SAM-dependent methyltransferase